MITQLSLKKFRIFEETTIKLGQMVTAIAGHNATGKSTLLGIIGNACELKGDQGKTITGNQFQTEFSELFKGSKKHDATGIIGSIFIKNNNDDIEIALRVAWQKYKTTTKELDRFRIIPKWTLAGKGTARKYPLPSFYLGLSRLYPLGEASNDEVKEKRRFGSIHNIDKEWLYKTYNHILTLNAPIDSISNYSINRKISGGINTEKYDYLTNSSGQDNLMQILYALLSFKQLHKKLKEQWKGGVLLIDEIDATLHPVAQIHLLDVILEVCTEIGLQVIFTTHSLQLLEYLNRKSLRKGKDNIVINYLTTANNDLEVHINPDQELIHNDMMIESRTRKQVIVYSEDAEARWFIRKLLSNYERYINIVDIKFGCDQAKTWLKTDPDYFSNILFVLDGEVSIGNKPCTNIVTLPGNLPPERVLYEYLLGLKAGHEYLKENAGQGLSIRFFTENGPDSEKYSKIEKSRERNKQWFINNESWIDDSNLFDFWARDNDALVKKFIKCFMYCHNIIAARTGSVRIPADKPE